MENKTKEMLNDETQVINLVEILENKDYYAASRNLEDAINLLKQKKNLIDKEYLRDEQIVEVSYNFKCFLREGAYAIYKAVIKKYGALDMASTGPSGNKPPTLIDVTLPDGKSIKVPWGEVSLPNFDEKSRLEMSYNSYDHIFQIVGTVRTKFIPSLEEIVELVRYELNNNSIYKGSAFYLKIDEDGEVEEPEFIDLNAIDENKVVLSKVAKEGLAPILMRIEKTKQCVDSGIDLKYGALMEGPYGTGKTLAAFYVAKKTIANKWTYIYLTSCKNLAIALRIAEQYINGEDGTGVVIFTEDIDQALRGERDDDMQEILNTLDGGDTKCKPIISIFTTNHIEKIEPTFMRGKRIGGLISLGPLDIETAEEFIEVMVPSSASDININKSQSKLAAQYLEGIVPAFASEIIDKAKVFMIERDSNVMNSEDIRKAAESYKRQMAYAELKHSENEFEKLKSALATVGAYFGKSDVPVSEELFGYLQAISKSTYGGASLNKQKK